MIKRGIDISASLLGLIILSPLLLCIAVAIELQSPGPVFYRGVRVGRYGKLFRIFKFRSMVVNADKIGGPSTAGDDRRVTPVGRWIRRYKFDELPQLLNVFVGEMSLVGPRPEVQEYIALLTNEEKPILSIRPGITDFASIWNSDEGAVLAGSLDPEKTYLEKIRPEKIRLQLKYVREQSLRTDLKIIAQTIYVSFFSTSKPKAL